jgi:ribosomal protein S18 acetylase RimI-like enzyme
LSVFLIHTEYRRKGIAQKILEKIILDYSNTEYDYIEAYPRKEESSSESSFKEPLELYKRPDFKIYNEYDSYYVMRKKLK